VSHVVINAITVPADQADELAARFAGRAGMVEQAEGFESFDLLRPLGGREQWLVVTRWRDEESFQAWVNSAAFGRGHGGGGHGGHGSPSPVATMSEMWSFSVEQSVRR
jgi:heme-degrading monooxygenase HmoA